MNNNHLKPFDSFYNPPERLEADPDPETCEPLYNPVPTKPMRVINGYPDFLADLPPLDDGKGAKEAA